MEIHTRQNQRILPATTLRPRRGPGFLWILAIALPACGIAPAGSITRPATLPLGVNRPNLAWVAHGNMDEQRKVIDAMWAAGVRRVRLTLNMPYDRVVEHLAYCNTIGMSVTLCIMPGNPAFFRAGAVPRKGLVDPRTNARLLYNQYRLADLDEAGYTRAIETFLNDCRRQGARMDALEVFNEVNWADFNGDLPVIEGGWWVGPDTPWDDPRYRVVRDGVRQCGRAIKATRAAAARVWPTSRPAIITPGLTDPSVKWVKRTSGSVVDMPLYLQLLAGRHPKQSGEENYLTAADGIGIHIYPQTVDVSPDTGLATALDHIARTMDPIVREVGTDRPFWMTEWGYQRRQFGSPSNEKNRLAQFRLFLDAMKAYRPGRVTWGPVLLFSFDVLEDHSVCTAGRLLDSAAILKTADY